MRCGVRWLSGLRQQLGQQVHRIEHNDVIALETLGTRHAGAKCEDGHARRESGLHAGNTVFNHRATIWLYGHRVGREQENRGIRLAVCDVIRTEDAPRESLGHSREAEFEVQHRMATTGRDATRHRNRIQGRDHAVDGFELAFADLAHPQFEFDLPIDGTTDVILDDRLHVHRRTTNESFNDLRLGEWPTEFGEYLRLGANREPFTVDEDPVAVEDHEIEARHPTSLRMHHHQVLQRKGRNLSSWHNSWTNESDCTWTRCRPCEWTEQRGIDDGVDGGWVALPWLSWDSSSSWHPSLQLRTLARVPQPRRRRLVSRLRSFPARTARPFPRTMCGTHRSRTCRSMRTAPPGWPRCRRRRRICTRTTDRRATLTRPTASRGRSYVRALRSRT